MRTPRVQAQRRIPNGLLGLIGAVAFLAFVYGAFTKRVPFVEGYRVTAVVQSSNELRSGSPVRIAGVDVGEVVELEKGDGDTALVTMELKDSGRPLHTDAEIRIRPRLFLEGGFYIEVDPGSPSAPEIDDGGTIPLGQTAIPVQFDQILTGAFARPSRESFTRIIDEVGTALDEGGARDLGRAQEPLVPALRDVAVVAEAAQGEKRGDVETTVRSLARITTALAANDDALGRLVSGMARTTAALADEQAALRASVRGIDGVLRDAPRALRAVDAGLGPTEDLVADARPALRAAPPVLRDAVGLVDQLDGATRPAELPRLVQRLDPAVRTLPRLEQRLGALFPLVDPVTDCVRDRVLPVLTAEVDDGALSTGRPVWQDLVHATVGLNSAAQNFDANGYQVRYNVGFGDGTINLGEITGFGDLTGFGSEAIAGVRPKWNGPGGGPAFRPDAPCREQAPADLRAEASPTVARFRKGGAEPLKVTSTQFRRAIARFAKEGR